MNTDADGSTDPIPATTDSSISSTGRMRAIPPAFKHIQANSCKTPSCLNFGVPPRQGPSQKGRGGSSDRYAIVNTGSVGLACRLCGKSSTLKNNAAIHQEMIRQGDRLWDTPGIRCQNDACIGNDPALAAFRRFGSTKSGSPRFQCRACGSTVSIGKPTLRQPQAHKNAQVFELLVNKVPLNRICEITSLEFTSLYRKINFIYDQCRHFSADRERHLAAMTFKRLYLCTDRQDYLVNWNDRATRKTIQLTAVASADLESGYVFGLIPNFDPSITQDNLEAQWFAAGDSLKPTPMRETARLWTLADYAVSAEKHGSTPDDGIEASENLTAEQQLPKSGCQVHADYLSHGHYWLLRHHFQGAEKLRFFLDQDAGMLGACMGAFADRVKNRTADIAIVRIDKNLTVDARNAAFGKAKSWFAAERQRFPALSAREARSAIMTEILAATRKNAPACRLNDLMIGIPFPDIAEPNKRIRFVSDFADYDDAHLANLLLKATLWPIDTVFNRVRRRLTLCERAIPSARRTTRLWHIYAPYNPEMLNKILTIFRVCQNYVWIGEKSNATAAEKIGLAQGKIRLQDILNSGKRTK